MEKNKMREINFETLEAVIHYTFGKINSNALLKIGDFIYTKKAEVLQKYNISVFLRLKTKRKRRGKQWRKITQRNRKV